MTEEPSAWNFRRRGTRRMRCPECGYPALDVGESRCPECGLVYDSLEPPPAVIAVPWFAWTAGSTAITTLVWVAVVPIASDEIEMIAFAAGLLVLATALLCVTVLRRGLTGERLLLVLVTQAGLFVAMMPLAFVVVALV